MKQCSEISISITLDRRIALEALVLNRLQRLPELRRDEWLRNLLIGGFRAECQSIKTQQFPALHSLATRELAVAHPNWLMQTPVDRSPSATENEGLSHQVAQKKAARVDMDSKPFAELAKIIG